MIEKILGGGVLDETSLSARLMGCGCGCGSKPKDYKQGLNDGVRDACAP